MIDCSTHWYAGPKCKQAGRRQDWRGESAGENDIERAQRTNSIAVQITAADRRAPPTNRRLPSTPELLAEGL